MRRLIRILLPAATLLAAACIENDIPYPTVEVHIESLSGEGFASTCDPGARTVTLALEETTDIRNVRIDQVQFAVVPHNTNIDKQLFVDGIRTSCSLTGTFDLRTPLYVTLSLYQNYDWTILAEQTIERRFSVAGQVGTTEFDLDNRIARAYVPRDADRSRVTITELKLGPAGITTYSPSMEELSEMDYSDEASPMHFVEVTAHGRTERWALYVLPTDQGVELTAADAWTRVIHLYGTGIEGAEMGFRYRKQGDEEWLPVPNVTLSGGSFSAQLAAEPLTAYEVTAFCGSEETDPVSVTTEAEQPLQGGGFEEWSTVNDIVYPYAEGAEPYWSTGNLGAALVKTTLTQSCAPRPGSAGKYGANLKSKFASFGPIGKFAAGNLFLGRYLQNDGTNGLLTFGRPFPLRPTGLRIWVKFKGGIVNYVGKYGPAGIVKNETPDNGIVYIALGTWTKEKYGVAPQSVPGTGGKTLGTDDSPVLVATRDPASFFKTDGEDVVGYGEYVMVDDIDEWKEVVIKIDYRATDIVPTHLMIVCSASRWGDYFTGSTESEMWLDDFELVYDPLP